MRDINDITYSEHALEKMTERNISKKMIANGIKNGDLYFDPQGESYIIALKNGYSNNYNLIIARGAKAIKLLQLFQLIKKYFQDTLKSKQPSELMIICKDELNTLLEKILESVEPKRKELIKKFQELLWKEEINGITEEEVNIYNTLAYDLDFYEPNEEWSKEDCAYYDEKKLVIIMIKALEQLKNLQ